ncbi:unnamed protein product [Discula destructiva]
MGNVADLFKSTFSSWRAAAYDRPGFALIAIVISSLVFLALYQVYFTIRYPHNLPLFGEPPGARHFSLRTRWRYYVDCAAMYKEAHEQYTKQDQPVLLPGLGLRRDIILPQSLMPWVLSRSESELSHADAILEFVQLKYSLGHEKYKADMWPGLLVKTGLNAILETVAVDVDDELSSALDTYFGSDVESWREVNLLQASRAIMGQVAARFVVGFPLCRDQEFLADLWKVMDGIVLTGGLAGAMPTFLRPVIGPVVAYKFQRDISRMKRHLEPLILRRQQIIDSNVPGSSQDEEIHDLLQMMLRFAKSNRPSEVQDLDTMVRRVCFAFFGAVHQTTILVNNVLLNIIGSNAEFNTIKELRNEVCSTETARNKPWTKRRIAQMVKCDSVARETLRLHSYTNRGLFRKILVDGLVTPSLTAKEGAASCDKSISLPRGTYLSFLGYPLQQDAERYDHPAKYDPFRFSRQRELGEGDTKPALTFVATSPGHLPFGHGTHSCPGRFLVDFEVKMLVAHVLEKYEIEFPEEYCGQRPAGKWLAEAFAPPDDARIRVKRRRD